MMEPGTACRLVFSEGDGLSGLVVDRYDRWLVVQFTSLGLAQRREILADLLEERLQPEGIFLRTERGIGKLEGLEAEDGLLRGTAPPGPVLIEEYGVPLSGQSGRGAEDRLLPRPARQPPGRCPFGRGPARARRLLLHGRLRAARRASGGGLRPRRGRFRTRLATRTRERGPQRSRQRGLRAGGRLRPPRRPGGAGEKFGLVVLDPPKFARDRRAIEEALRGYRRLQALALRLLEPDGFLVTCCCSGLITTAMLEDLLAQLAADARREVQILQRRGPAPDHPVSVSCLESHYLKCLIAPGALTAPV